MINMKNLIAFFKLTKRNTLVYLRDRSTVLFSMLAPIIVLSLYLLFLKDMYVRSVTNCLSEMIQANYKDQINAFINSWLISGILGTSVVTVSLNSLTVMVHDKEEKVDYDYTASPVSKIVVTLSYFTGALINTFLIGAICLTCGYIYLACTNSLYQSAFDIFMTYIILFIGACSSTVIMMIVASFFKKSSGLGAFGGIVSAAVGFVIGAYMPITEFDKSIQSIANTLPGSHIAALFRNYLMSGVLTDVTNSLGSSEFENVMRDTFAFNLNMFDNYIDINGQFAYVLITGAIFMIINIIVFRLNGRRK